jgi:hypothetical protein
MAQTGAACEACKSVVERLAPVARQSDMRRAGDGVVGRSQVPEAGTMGLTPEQRLAAGYLGLAHGPELTVLN